MNSLAKNFLHQVDVFLEKGSQGEQHMAAPPSGIVNFAPFSTQRLRGRVVNRVLRIPLKVMHKASAGYFVSQQNTNDELRQKIDTLEARLALFESSKKADRE